MRNAAARLDDDYGFGEPAPKNKARRRAAVAKPKRKQPAKPGKRQARYIRYAAAGLTAALSAGIVINALALQNSRHPAPLFGKAIELGDQPVLQTANADQPGAGTSARALAPVPPAPPLPAARADAPVVNTPVANAPKIPAAARESDIAASHVHHGAPDASASTHHTKAAKPEHPADAAAGDDAIGAMLKTAAPADKPAETSKTILAVQHALMKIGYVVSLDGNYGAGTRTAIEAFEREEHLPVTGELSRKLLKQLSAEAGVAID